MHRFSTKNILTQPLVGIVTSAIGVALLITSWAVGSDSLWDLYKDITPITLALALTAALYLACQFPVHIRHTVKIEMGTVPLYLIAALLVPPLAALTAGIATFAGECSSRKHRHTVLSDKATMAARWSTLCLIGSLVVHTTPQGYTWRYLLVLVAMAAILLAGDILTAPLQISPVTGERPVHLIVECTKAVGLPEAGQYVVGIAGALLAIGDVWHAALLFLPTTAVYKLSKRAREMHESTRLLLENMADDVDRRDSFTHEHSKRVTAWTQKILREMRLVGPEVELIVTAARVHDIGKLSIPMEILHKDGKLSPEEWAVMETHPGIGADIVSRYQAFAHGAAVVRGHHERLDGKGYPDGLKGMDIPFGARVIAVADSYDAMTSDRPYRKGMPVERASAILAGGKGTQWDPDIVEAFLRCIADVLEQPVAEKQAAAGPVAAS